MAIGSKARPAYCFRHGLRQRRKAGQLDQMSLVADAVISRLYGR